MNMSLIGIEMCARALYLRHFHTIQILSHVLKVIQAFICVSMYWIFYRALKKKNVQVLYVLGKLNCMLFYCFAQIQLTMLARHKQSIVMRIALAAFA